MTYLLHHWILALLRYKTSKILRAFFSRSSSNWSSTGGVVLVRPALFHPASLDGALNEGAFCFSFKDGAIFTKCLYIHMKPEIERKQELHLQFVHLRCAYASHSSIICIIVESENYQIASIIRKYTKRCKQ